MVRPMDFSRMKMMPWLLALALLLPAARPSLAASAEGPLTLAWRRDRSADAAVEKQPLQKVLARLAAAARWNIFVEPGLNPVVTARFRNASHADALKLLLGGVNGVNYAFVPKAGKGALYVYETSASAATRAVKPEPGRRPANWLSKEILVVTDKGEDVEKLAKELGGKVLGKSEELNAYRIEFADEETAEKAREKLSEQPGLDVQDNFAYDRPAAGTSAGASPSNLFPLDSKPVSRGDQITVALVDTAVQPLEGKMKDFLLPAVQVRERSESLPTEPTHGTSMAQTILHSMAFAREPGQQTDTSLGKVRVLPIDIYGGSPSTSTFDVAQGLYAAIQSGSQVINLSLGGEGGSPLVDYLLEGAREKQILVFASAGNSPTTDLTWPAANPNAIAVTAADWQGNIAPYANRGDFVDLKAPGNARVYLNGQTYISTGTSTATAFVSGQAAALAARGLTQAQTTEAILRSFDVHAPAAPRGAGR